LLLATFLGVAGSACFGTVVPHNGPATYSFGDLSCGADNTVKDTWYHITTHACSTFKVKDSTFVLVMVKTPDVGVQGTVQVWMAVDGKNITKIKEKNFKVGASTKPQTIVSATLSGGHNGTYIAYIEVPPGTPRFDYMVYSE
jgi:hypothetical protein